MLRIKGRFTASILACILVMPILLSAQEYDWAAIDEEAFEKTQPTEKIMDIIGIKAGMFVAEVGAGGGRVAVRVARRVGPGGRVYANDITDSAIAYMRQRIQRENIQNIEVVKGTLTDPLLPKGKLDVVYMTFTYRHLDKPAEVLKNIGPSLKPGGVLAIIDSKNYNRDPSTNKILKNAGLAGFKLTKLETSLPEDDIYLFHVDK